MQPADDPSVEYAGVTMRPLTLAFADEHAETGFLRDFAERQVFFARIALIIGTAFVSVFGLLDLVVAGEATSFCLAVRFGVMFPAVVAGLIIVCTKAAERWATLAQLVPTVIAGLGVIAMTLELPSPASEQYYAGVIVVLVFGHALTYSRFIHVTAASAVIIGAYAATAFVHGVDVNLLSNLFFLVAAELALMFGSYLQELQRRRLYLQTESLERLSDELEQQAMLDPLTGLGNRRALEVRLAEAYAEARRYDVPTTLLLADLDHFKRVNDELGHPRGDAFLVAFARRIEEVLRGTDLAFRYGGDEFLILAPHTDVSEALPVAERVRDAAQDLARDFGVATLDVSCSIGIAAVDADDDNTPLSAVDAALYAAKAARQGIQIADADAPGQKLQLLP